MQLKRIFRQAALFLVATLFALSCSKEPIPESPVLPSNENSIISFKFEPSVNPGLSSISSAFFNDKTLYVTLPRGYALSLLKANIEISPKALIKVNGAAFTSNSTPIDYTNTVTITVTSESGVEKSYKVLVQGGIAALDNMIYSFMKKYSIPGISYAISKNEQIVYSSGIGYAITESEQRVVPSNLFRLASCSKQFTSFCILKLLENGLLSLDQKVFGTGGILGSEYPNVTSKAADVTVKHLLSHTSGWTSDPDPMFTSSFAGQTLDQRITYMLTSAQSTPGTSFSYYNMGFGVLGKIIEKVSGKEFEVFLKEQLALAGITDVHVGGTLAQRRSNEVVYYSQSGTNGYANEMQVIKAAGGIIASAPEMLKLAHQIDGYALVPDIITSQTRSLMINPPFPSTYTRYGLGWRLNHTYYPNSIYHAGNLSGTATQWVVGENLNLVVLCNSRSYISTFDDEMYGLLKDIRTLASTISW